MRDLQELNGIGEKTVEKIYSFVNSQKSNRIITESERKPGFDFKE